MASITRNKISKKCSIFCLMNSYPVYFNIHILNILVRQFACKESLFFVMLFFSCIFTPFCFLVLKLLNITCSRFQDKYGWPQKCNLFVLWSHANLLQYCKFQSSYMSITKRSPREKYYNQGI